MSVGLLLPQSVFPQNLCHFGTILGIVLHTEGDDGGERVHVLGLVLLSHLGKVEALLVDDVDELFGHLYQ